MVNFNIRHTKEEIMRESILEFIKDSKFIAKQDLELICQDKERFKKENEREIVTSGFVQVTKFRSEERRVGKEC